MKPPYAIGSVPSLSGHAIAYRWRSLPRVRRHRASKPQGSFERVLPWQITMDQLIFASLSHTHYWYEVGMLKVPWKRLERAEKQLRVDTRRRVAQKLGPTARMILSQTQAFGDGGYSWKRWGAGSRNHSRCHDAVICLYSGDLALWYQQDRHSSKNLSSRKCTPNNIPRRVGPREEIP